MIIDDTSPDLGTSVSFLPGKGRKKKTLWIGSMDEILVESQVRSRYLVSQYLKLGYKKCRWRSWDFDQYY